MNEAEKAQAMPYQSTIFAQLLKALPRDRFERLASPHRKGRKKRSLPEWGHFVAMVFAQGSGARSLRDLERLVERQDSVLSHLGIAGLKRATLADANATRPAAMFEDIVRDLVGQLAKGQGGHEIIRLIDATQMFAGHKTDEWSTTGGIKLHLMYDLGSESPVCFAVTPDKLNDVVAAQAMPIEKGMTYVFDRAYYHYALWAKIDAAGSRFVTRLKKNSPAHVIREQPVAQGANIRRDAIVTLNERLTTTRNNPLAKPLRLIDVEISTGKTITLISNDIEAKPEAIAALYKKRWQIELFFKWIKQNLKLGHFLGASRNAIITQIMAALCVYLLLRIAQIKAKATLGLQAIARLSSAFLLIRRPINDILKPPPKPPQGQLLQLSFWK